LSAPKKGKDLSALKARLAKKAKPAGEEAAPVPAPGEVIEQPAAPPPSEVETQAAPAEVPPPGEVAAAPAPEPAAAPAAPKEETPFGGGASFDPSAGIIDDAGVDVKPRKNTGLTILVALGGIAFGTAIGWLAQKGVDTSARVESAKAKGGEMFQEVSRLKDVRAKISMGMEDVKKATAEDPKKGAEALTALLTENFGGDQPTEDKLFGWQLASMHPRSINAIFSFYTRYTVLQMALVDLASHMQANAAVLAENAGPARFAVINKNTGAVLVEYVKPICNLEEKAPCAEGKEGEAVGYEIRETLGGPTAVVPTEQATPLLPEGPMFKYAFGDKPERNASIKYARLMSAVESQLEEMSKVEKRALSSLEAYVGDPTVDGSNPQPDPGE
jgi:hypothetical protein